MKELAIAYHTDIGIKRQSNQDSILLKGLEAGTDEIVLAVLCDGMGGMEKGELASATVVRAFSQWFEKIYVQSGAGWNIATIKKQWKKLLADCNEKLQNYGQKQSAQLGTTATALLLHSSGKYFIGHIGDTRVYKLSQYIQQLTEDHTFVAREIRNGNMTEEQAQTDTRRNVLLQCIGVNGYFEPQFLEGFLERGEAVLLCSDGFRHEVSATELFDALNPQRFYLSEDIKQVLFNLVELNKRRNETDNISSIYIKRL